MGRMREKVLAVFRARGGLTLVRRASANWRRGGGVGAGEEGRAVKQPTVADQLFEEGGEGWVDVAGVVEVGFGDPGLDCFLAFYACVASGDGEEFPSLVEKFVVLRVILATDDDGEHGGRAE
jgi:hypothetical protein